MHITGTNGSNTVFQGTDILAETGIASGYQSYNGSFNFSGVLNTVKIEIGGRDINLAIGPLFDDVSVNVFYNVISTIIEQQITTVEEIVYLNLTHPTQIDLIEEIIESLNEGKPARDMLIDDKNRKIYQELNLLTSKPIFYICNVEENDASSGNKYSEEVQKYAEEINCKSITISASTEAELSILSDEEKVEYLKSIGLQETGLNKVIKTGYEILNLVTYFTSGPKETRAWTIRKDTQAPKAASVIHTDFEKGFIRAETISFDDFIKNNGENGAKEAGKMRLEGKDYIVQDGDVMHFRFNN